MATSPFIRLLAGLPVVMILTAAGCQSGMYDENIKLHQQARALQAMNTDIRTELQSRPDEAQLAALQQEIAERDRMIADLQNRLSQPGPDGIAITGLEGIDVSYQDGEMTMRVPGDVLFASGSTTVNNSAETTLGRIAEILNSDYAGKEVRVVGHTDNDPISKTKKLYADNRDLSMKRAYAVTKTLVGKGVEPNRILAGGMGEYESLGADKKKDRRVEIIVVM